MSSSPTTFTPLGLKEEMESILLIVDPYSYITHYSYFGAFRSDVSNVGPNAAMLTQDGKLTDIGSWYLGGSATGNKPKGAGVRNGVLAGWSAVVAAVVAICFLLEGC